MRTNKKGQAALVMIVVLALSFIFYSIELNWGRLADLKISTWMAAHSASSAMASNFASYTERLLQEYLFSEEAQDKFDYFPPKETVSDDTSFESGDLLKYTACQGDWLFLKILVIIIIIIIVILTWGAATPLLVWVGIALMVISLVLEYAVIMPMQRAMWNKLMRNLQPIDQMRETGIQTGMLSLANDTVNLPDRFDMNGNGRWGFSTRLDIGEPYQPNDTIGRLSFFYTERLKHVKPQKVSPNDAYQDFVSALGNFVGTSALGGSTTGNGITSGDGTGNTGTNVSGATAQGSGSLGTSLFCGGSKTRHTTSLELRNAGLDPIDIFNKLINKGWSSAIKATPNNPGVTEVQLLVDFSDQNIIDQTYDIFGANRDTVLGVLQNAQASNVSPLCDPVCTHGVRPTRHGYNLGWTYGNSTSGSSRDYVPSVCMSCDPSLPEYQNAPCPAFSSSSEARDRRLLYNPYLENPIPPNTLNKADKGFSFGSRFGHDDEFGKDSSYSVLKTSGIVFPMLDQMDHLQDPPGIRAMAATSDGTINTSTGQGQATTASGGNSALAQDIKIIYQYVGVENSGGNAEVLSRDITAYQQVGGTNSGTMFSILHNNLQPDAKQMIFELDQHTSDVAQLRSRIQPISSRMSTKVTHIQSLINADLGEANSWISYINSINSDEDTCCMDATPWINRRDAVQRLNNDLVLLRNTLNRIPGDITISGGSNNNAQHASTPGSYNNPQLSNEVNRVPIITDSVGKILNYKASDGDCAFESNSAQGIFWKKGADRYCSGTVMDYMKKDPKADPKSPLYDANYAKTNPLYDTEYAVQTKHNISFSPDGPNTKHWPYEDCTYMRNSSTGEPVSCGTTSPSLWPQDRLDALVYGLPALVGINEALHDADQNQLNLGINQWYPLVASFIAPKCTASACTELQKYKPNQQCGDLCQGKGCEAMNNNPVIASMVAKYGNNHATCNPQYHGYILQWWYDMQNWMKLTYDWLYNPPSGGLCTGPTVAGAPGTNTAVAGFNRLNADGPHPSLPPVPPSVVSQAGNVVDCLYQKSYFLQDLDDCWYGTLNQGLLNTNEPVSAPFPSTHENDRIGTVYPYMTYACKKVIWEAQRYGATNFVTSIPSGLPKVGEGYGVNIDSTGRPSGPGIITDYPPNNGSEDQASTKAKEYYEKIRAWVQVNQVTVHAVKSRYGDLSDLSYKAIDAMNLFNEGAVKFYGFINPTPTTRVVGVSNVGGAPYNTYTQPGTSVGGGYGATPTTAATVNYDGAVYELMGTRSQNGISTSLKLPRLPGFAIYGWQDGYNESKKVVSNGVESPTGKWHIARVEVQQPDALPIIQAGEEWGFHGWSGPHYNCYTASNIRGDVWVRATRWDAPNGEIAQFGNKGANIWGFTYSNLTSEHASEATIDNMLIDGKCPGRMANAYTAREILSDPSNMLNQYCRGKNIGRTANSVEGYQQSASSGDSNLQPSPSTDAIISDAIPRSVKEEAFNLNDAFMFNFNPLEESTKDYMDVSDPVKNCYCIANAILMNQGISNASGAHWAIPVSMTSGPTTKWHTQIKFNNADDAKGKFPSSGDTMKDDLSSPTESED